MSITALQLLESVHRRGGTLVVRGGRVVPRIHPGALTPADREALGAHQQALKALLRPWDSVKADAEVEKVEYAVAEAQQAQDRTDAQRRVLTVYRNLAARYHQQRDRLLFDVLEAVERCCAGWRGPHAGTPTEERRR